MTAFWLGALPLVVSLAWLRYRHVAAEADRPRDVKAVLKQSTPSQRWGAHDHQQGAQWLQEIFERSAERYPHLPALSVPHTGERLTYAALNHRADQLAAIVAQYLSGPDQIVAVQIPQTNSDIVALHLAILKAGGVQLFIDPEAPEALVQQMLSDAAPVLLIREPIDSVDAWPTLSPQVLDDVAAGEAKAIQRPQWCDDPAERLASLFYTSGTTGKPKGVECTHAGYINLAQSYADFFDFVPGSDVSSLTSSLGYDGSISELYSAWVAGCEVALLTKAELRAGPDLIPILREWQVTALFCPPVLLSTLTATPEDDLPYPICRYVVPAGEAFPTSLVAPWSRARRQIINTYGPTEAGTDTSRQLLRPNEPVTIGSPFAGVSYYILDPDSLALLPHGTEGELCIGGCQLARGYRNLASVTQERFIDHPDFGRLYRSGDRCHVDPATLRVHFHGRLDAQLKVRGFRVEAQPIESLLQDHFPEIDTAVLDCQNDELVAFIRAPSLWVSDSDVANTAPLRHDMCERARAMIAQTNPPYAVPGRFFLIRDFTLMPASGKIDRRSLPRVADIVDEPRTVPEELATSLSAGESALEPNVLKLCQSVLGAHLTWHDDFIDFGAHSIAIAKLTQVLQQDGYPVSVRSLLSDYRSAAQIAEHMSLQRTQLTPAAETEDRSSPDNTPAPSRLWSFRAFCLLQLAGILILRIPLLVMAVAALAVIDPEELLLAGEVIGFLFATVQAYCLYLVLPFVNLGWVRWLRVAQSNLGFDSDLPPATYRKFTSHHLQLWWLEQQTYFVLRPLSRGLRSPLLLNWILRTLGAKIHASAFVSQSAEWEGPVSLVTIGEGAIVQSAAQISTVFWSGDTFTLQPIEIARGARVGSRSMMSGGAILGEYSWLTPLSSLATPCPPYSQISGVPGTRIGSAQPLRTPPLKEVSRVTRLLTESRNVLLQLALELGLIIVPGALIAVAVTFLLGLESLDSISLEVGLPPWQDLIMLSISGIAGIWLAVLSSSLLLSLFLRLTPTPPGWTRSYSIHGTLSRYRQQKMNQLQQMWGWSLTGQYLRALAGVRFSKIGASECDALMDVLPEHLSAHANVFIAQGCFCHVLDEHGEFLLTRSLHLSEGFFGSNNAMAESGTLPGNLLLGVSTGLGPHLYRSQYRDYPDPHRVLMGNPPLELGSSAQAQTASHPSPSLWIFLARFVLNDLASVGIIPGLTVFLAAALLISLNAMGFGNVTAALLASIVVPVALPFLTLAIKLLLVGNRWGREHSAPFWSVRHFSYFLAQDCFFRLLSGFLGTVSGTALANPLLRRFGCKIGKRTLIGLPLQLSDWHAVNIGDDCVINGQFQLHSFENWTLTVSQGVIGHGSTINHGTMMMGGAQLDSGVTVHPQTLILKSMHLAAGHHAGSPAQLLSASS